MATTKTPQPQPTVKTPAAPPAEPTVAELEAAVAEAQARLQAARDAETLKDRLTDCGNIITDAANALDKAADGTANGEDTDTIVSALTLTIDHCMQAIRTLSPEPEKATRTRNGQLRPLVKAYLTEHEGDQAPADIARELGRSSGAVANACDALVRDGEAKLTQDSPKRYQAIPATTAS